MVGVVASRTEAWLDGAHVVSMHYTPRDCRLDESSIHGRIKNCGAVIKVA